MGICKSRLRNHDDTTDDTPAEVQSYERFNESLDAEIRNTSGERTPPFDLESYFPGTHSIERMVMHAKYCFKALGLQELTDEQLEEVAILIYDSMEAPTRTFHTVEHLHELCQGADALQHIAIAFHDLIYYTIDGGLSDAQRDYVGDLITEQDGIVKITNVKLEPLMVMAMDIFGYTYGQTLDPYKGMNEFLSAGICIRCLVKVNESGTGGGVPLSQMLPLLIQIVACIEATIPFRTPDDQGRNPPDILFSRLQTLNNQYSIQWDEATMTRIVQRATDLGNRDLDSFSSTDRKKFLTNTWDLLPESNVALRQTSFYLNDIVLALSKMAKFFEFLDPETLYFSFRDDATELINKGKTAEAINNINTALTYMHCMLLKTSILSAVAMLTGGDAPKSLFMGDVPPRYLPTIHRPPSRHLTDYLDIEYQPAKGLKLNEFVLKLLIEGREHETTFDTKNCPISYFIYAHIGDVGLKKSIEYCKQPMNETTSLQLLESLPLNLTLDILAACANLAITRRKRIHKIMEQFRENEVKL